MITTRLNLLISIIVFLIAISSLALNYSLVYNNKKSHLEQDMKNYVKNRVEQINEMLVDNKSIDNRFLNKLTNKYLSSNDVPLFFAFIDEKGNLISENSLPENFLFSEYISENHSITHFYDEDENVFMIANIKIPQSIFIISGFSKQALSDSIFDENFYIAAWVMFCLIGYITFIVYYTKTKIDRPLRNFLDSNLREFVNGILASYTDCTKMKSIENIMLPSGLKNRLLETFGMLQKWSCYKIHFDEFLRMTVAESDKNQLVNNLFMAIEKDFFVKRLVLLEINHSLNRFEPIMLSSDNHNQEYPESILSDPSTCLSFRTGNRVFLDDPEKSPCSTCPVAKNETVLCKPMMSSGKQTGVIKFTLDNEKIEKNGDINSSSESKIRFLESYLTSYIDLTSLTISNINLLNAYKNQALTDPLTNIYNRRYITEYLYGLLNISKSKESPLSVFMIDIDNFKRFNDEYGHKTGDSVLKVVSRTIEQSIREGDTVARYGGEEFITVLPYSDLDVAFEVGERVRDAVEHIEWADFDLPNIHPVTISLGIAAYPIHGYSHYHLTNAADKALYRAKRSGRNRVVVHEIKEREEERRHLVE